MGKKSVLFFGKKNDPYTLKALEYCKAVGFEVNLFLGDWGDPFPVAAHSWEGEYVVSFLSRWIIPENLLKRAKGAAINFHPAPPSYPGIGCNNFALFDGVTEYGVTCHHMDPRVDVGSIIQTKKFDVFPGDSADSLLSRTYDYLLILFYEVVNKIANGIPLPISGETWTRHPYTRKEFNELGKIDFSMNQEEVEKRIRATVVGPWRPRVELYGYVFELKTDLKKH